MTQAFLRYLIEAKAVWAEFRTHRFDEIFKFVNTSDARKYALYEWISSLYDLRISNFTMIFVDDRSLEVGNTERSKMWDARRRQVCIHNMVCEIMFISTRVILINMIQGDRNKFLYEMFKLSNSGCNCIIHWSSAGRGFEKTEYFNEAIKGNMPYLTNYSYITDNQFKSLARQELIRNNKMRELFLAKYYIEFDLDGDKVVRIITENLID